MAMLKKELCSVVITGWIKSTNHQPLALGSYEKELNDSNTQNI